MSFYDGKGFKVEPLSRKDIRNFAQGIRKKFKLSKPKFPIVYFIEMLPNIVRTLDYHVCEPSEMDPGNMAEYLPRENWIRIREDVWDGANNGSGRDRFTLAHEIGHFFLHRNVVLALPKKCLEVKHKKYENSEWQADCFAGELLFPHHLVHLAKNEKEAAEIFGISLSAAQTQWNAFRVDSS